MAVFNKGFYTIENKTLRLELIETNEGNEKALPFYWWEIILKEINKEIGKISLRIGHNYHSYFNGNVGYEIDSEYRGHNYAYKACELIIPVAKYHGMNFIYITCDFDNIPSIKTIEKLGAEFLEEVIPPKDYVFYFDGISSHKIYKLSIKYLCFTSREVLPSSLLSKEAIFIIMACN